MVTINYPSATGGGDWLPVVIPVYLVVWLLVLGLALTRKDLDPVTRLMWVLVVILVPVGGIFLYLLLGPARESNRCEVRGDFFSSVKDTPWEDNPGHTPRRNT